MDVKEKLVELIAQKVCDTWSESCDEWLPHDCGKCYANDCLISEIADHLISNGVTVQEWISVDDKLPEYSNDGFVDAVLVTDGFVQHMAYFIEGGWLFAESGEIKEPMWYRVTPLDASARTPEEDDKNE